MHRIFAGLFAAHLLFVCAGSAIAAKHHAAKPGKKNRAQQVRVVYHKAPVAAHVETAVAMQFVRGCATEAELPALATRLNLDAEKIRKHIPATDEVSDGKHCLHYAAARSPSSHTLLALAYPSDQDAFFTTLLLSDSEESVHPQAFSGAAASSGGSAWREIRISALDLDSAPDSELDTVPEHLQWELAILVQEISKKAAKPDNYYLRLVLEEGNDGEPEKIRGLELIEKSDGKLIDSVVWLEREEETGAFFNTGGADYEKLFWQSPVKFRRLSRGIGKSVTLEKKRVKIKTASKKTGSKKTAGKKHAQKFRKILVRHHRQHIGVDFAAPMGTPVNAVAEAYVAFKGLRGAYGNLVVLEHGADYHTYYAHLSKFAEDLYVGKKILRGEEIGLVGSTGRSTGPHLHFEIRKQGLYVDPLSDDYSLDIWRLHGDEAARLLTTMLKLDVMRAQKPVLITSTLNTLQKPGQ